MSECLTTKINDNYKAEFDRLAERLGGNKDEILEAAIKILISLPDEHIEWLRRPSTTIDSAKQMFAGLRNIDKVSEIIRNKIIESTNDEEREFWHNLNDLLVETFILP